MVDALLYMTLCSFRNRLRIGLRRLREPRYLLGSIVGVLYFYFLLFRGGFRSSNRTRQVGSSAFTALGNAIGPLQFVGSVVLLIIVAVAWAVPRSVSALSFTRAETQFLFQAPLTRRQLLSYKIIRGQISSLVTSVLFALLFRRSTLGGAGMFVIGSWLIMTALNLHLIGVSLSRQSLASHGRSGFARQWLPLAVLVGALSVIAGVLAQDWPRLAALSGFREVFDELQRLSNAGVLSYLFWPFRMLVRIPLAASAGEFWRSIPAALGIVAVNYIWVLRSDAAFEEASAEAAERVARLPALRRSSPLVAKSTPFRLAAEGRPETAILWKNLIAFGRYASLKKLLPVLTFVVIIGLSMRRGPAGGVAEFMAVACAMLTAMTVLFGPQVIRNDLRQDLGYLATLKTWPVRGSALIRGEALAPAAILTGVAWIFILTLAFLLGGLPLANGAALSVLDRVSYAAAAMLVAPTIILAQLVAQNGIAVMFPAWITVGRSRAGGVSVMGQRLVIMVVNFLVLALALIPAAIAAGGFAVAGYAMTRTVFVVAPAIIMAAVMLGECWLASEGLGRALDRTDVSATDPIE